jgi:hypothetical protein
MAAALQSQASQASATSTTFLSTFLPSAAPASSNDNFAASHSRTLLVGPNAACNSSLLLQHCLHRARRGLSTLYVACSSLEKRPPAKPRLIREHDLDDDADTSTSMDELLRRIHIKQVSSWQELRELLCFLHTSELTQYGEAGVPRGLVIDDLSALFATSAGDHPSQLSPGVKQQTNTAMFLANALALAANAAEYLDVSEYLDVTEPSSLLVACSSPAPEVELAERWLPTIVRVAIVKPGVFALSCKRGALGDEEACVHCKYDGKRISPVASVEATGLHAFHDQFGANGASPFAASGGGGGGKRPRLSLHGGGSQPLASAVF